jgi:pre-mRNA-splicing factor SYF2
MVSLGLRDSFKLHMLNERPRGLLFGYTVDADTNAHKLYNKNTHQLKPDLVAYNRQKELALGLAPGTIVPVDAKSVEGSSVVTSVNATGSRRKIIQSSKALSAMEDLYRDANTLSYGDNKASDDAIDRVVGKINAE